MTAPCECLNPGFCVRHGMNKVGHVHGLCQTSEQYRELWDRMAAARVCGAWRPVSQGVWACGACKREAGAHDVSSLPANRHCQPQAPTVIAPPSVETKKCGGCGAKTEESPKPEMPPLIERGKNLLSSLVDFAKQPGLADPEEAKADLETCEKCQHVLGHSCSVCGCWLSAAVRVESKNCPTGKWKRDARSWKPHVHQRWLSQTLVVIPHYGDPGLTRACVADCQREGVAVLVVDNSGNYQPVAKEDVVLPGENIGWGAACNVGINRVLEPNKTFGDLANGVKDLRDFEAVVLLNNDTRLSTGFFSGLIVAQRVTKASIVSAVYNVGWGGQKPKGGFAGQAHEYKPKPTHRMSNYCDGTAVLLTRELLEDCGPLDLKVSPKHGWGLLIDLAMRAQEKGHSVSITEASYVYHHGMQAALKVHGTLENYLSAAITEQRLGLTAKWGPNWRETIDGPVLMPKITTRNLIYHVAPFANNGVWLKNVRQLLKRIGQFNGQRIVAISTGDEMLSPDEVKRAFRGHEVEFLLVTNDRRLRENASFPLLMDKVASTDRNTATFYAHAKGVCTPGDPTAVMHWRNAMYHKLLDDPEQIDGLLRTHKIVGTHRLRESDFPDLKGSWHFSGTFWWFRHDALFGQRNWRERIPDNGWGVEAYPGMMFTYDESACVYHDEAMRAYEPEADQLRIDDDPFDAPPAVSIIVTARNQGQWLDECLRSCVSQDYPACEVIYCDDGSQDGSVDIARSIDGVKVISLSAQGAAIARNHAAGKAIGNALLFVDGDNSLPPDYVSRMVEALTPQTPFAYPDIQQVGDATALCVQPDYSPETFREKNCADSCSLMWAKSFFDVGGWKDGTWGHLLDWHLFMRLATLGSPAHAKATLNYRVHSGQWSASFDQAQLARARTAIMSDIFPAKTVKVELGGGTNPRGSGYLNVDKLPCADVVCDFDAPDARLPFDDDSVSDLYSSHCLEHVRNLRQVMREIVRVCRVGARVEIRVPHWLSNMAMCQDHKHTISHEQIDHWDRTALGYWWEGMAKRLKAYSTDYVRGPAFDEWRSLMPHAQDDQILRLCPDACHEAQYVFFVVENA